ncbi:RxLR-like protein [Plasmopara halstedii]|uniref:RxLR-like protein n=1 Tax=Plasmopara halstedii TaxID=4781 RepID=A0A0N7L4K1_PLAHL|nr:RxLR-like protein [Plasmopara halstedii]CEG38899.1 RxLR-like protein [Plasmopara halstedii]|eukprot:XP_024575268.1 RxLR-like protein [Plasmopara halstedii]
MFLAVFCAIAFFNLANADDGVHPVINKFQYDKIKPFPVAKRDCRINEIALDFQPMLRIESGCHPYPAVDKNGYVSDGLGVSHWFTDCSGSPEGSQVYGRAYVFKGYLAIMYAWYFPRDFMVTPFYVGHRHGWEHAILWIGGSTEDPVFLAATVESTFGYKKYSPVPTKYVKSDHFKLEYTWLGVTHHYLTATKNMGEFQDLVMWNNLTDEARVSLNEKISLNFNSPLSDKRFFTALRKSYPF